MIELFDGYAIGADSRQFILKKKTSSVDKNGKPVYRELSYHKTVEGAIRALWFVLTREQAQTNRLTLKESYEQFKTLTERMENLKLKEEE